MTPTKRLIALLLVICAVAGVLSTNALAVSDVSTFPDITDATVGEAVESLRMMGVLNGTGDGLFTPEGTLTRAEFCKMAVLAMGKADEVAAYEMRTIFPDVPSTHWARGYINLASKTMISESPIIKGVGDGTFAPSRTISYAETVTVILRILGYGKEANDNWPYGAVTQASKIDLAHDIRSHSAGDTITRAEASILFRNMLLTPSKDSEEIYASTLGTLRPKTVILAVDSKGVRLSGKDPSDPAQGDLTYYEVKPAVFAPDKFFVGKGGTAVLDSKNRLLTFLPDNGSIGRTIVIEEANATGITAISGERFSVPRKTPVMHEGVETTYADAIRAFDMLGLTVTIYFNSEGEVSYIYVESASTMKGSVMVSNDYGWQGFQGLALATGCAIIKNGCIASASDIAPNDVGLYDQGRNTLYITDFRIQATYEDADPNPIAPNTVTLFGQKFKVADSALKTIGNLRLGQTVIAMFAPDGSIAKLVSSGGMSSNALGVLTSGGEGGSVIELINAPAGFEKITGTVSLPKGIDSVDYYKTQISYVSGWGDEIYLSPAYSGYCSEIDLNSHTMGNVALAESLTVYEQVGSNGPLTRISLRDIAMSTVPGYRVTYSHLNFAGKADVLVLNDVTGDRYTYGLVKTRLETVGYKKNEKGELVNEEGKPLEEGEEPVEIKGTITTITYDKDKSIEVAGDGLMGGVGGAAPSILKTEVGEFTKAAGFNTLTPIRSLPGESFYPEINLLVDGGAAIPLAADVLCYDSRFDRWYDDLEKFLVDFGHYTAYYDRSPATGGKVRIIVAE